MRRRAVAPGLLVGGAVPALLVVAAVLAALSGMFAPGTTRAVASSMSQESTSRAMSPLPSPPAQSGTGRRVVFDQSDQRVWLVGADGTVERTYLVSGSNRNNVSPGTYRVKSHSRYARSYNGNGTFEYFVRFTEGRNAPIGFHSVTVKRNGELKLARSDLGKPSSPGCVEQWRDDAVALWEFAPVGTAVVVTQ